MTPPSIHGSPFFLARRASVRSLARRGDDVNGDLSELAARALADRRYA
jgi:hypothetical protein